MAEEINEEPFDVAMKRLESIVEKLERGDIPLEKVYETFQDGISLVKELNRRLDDMELKIKKLVGEGESGFRLEPFEPPAEE